MRYRLVHAHRLRDRGHGSSPSPAAGSRSATRPPCTRRSSPQLVLLPRRVRAGATAWIAPDYRSIETFADDGRPAAEPRGLLQRLGRAVQHRRSPTDAPQHGVIPFVQIDPSFATVSAIADGSYDTYLQSYADSVRDFGHPVVIGFGHEMNGYLVLLGLRARRPAGDLRGRLAAHRHPVPRTRARTTSPGSGPSTEERPRTGPIRAWWPGASYVTWVGIDGYYARPCDTFPKRLRPHHQPGACHHQRADPAVRDRRQPQAGQPFAKILNLFDGVQSQHVLGLVWFDVNQPAAGSYQQDWQLEANPQAAGRLPVRAVASSNIVHP